MPIASSTEVWELIILFCSSHLAEVLNSGAELSKTFLINVEIYVSAQGYSSITDLGHSSKCPKGIFKLIRLLVLMSYS